MKNRIIMLAVAMLMFCLGATGQTVVTVDANQEVGQIKMMNAANNGPYEENLKESIEQIKIKR